MNISCFLVDDDPISIKTLTKYIKKTPELKLAGSETSPLRALKYLQNNESVNVVFLDINMEEMNGLELASLLQGLKTRSLFIFTTGYPEYAAEAFDMNIADYLVKPIGYDRFLQAIERLQEKLQARQDNKPEDDFFYFYHQAEKKLIRLRTRDVDYFEAFHNHIKILARGKEYSVLMSLSDVESQLPALFMRVHRSFIVNSDRIASVMGNVIKLEDDTQIAIGASYREIFFNKLNQKMLRKKS